MVGFMGGTPSQSTSIECRRIAPALPFGTRHNRRTKKSPFTQSGTGLIHIRRRHGGDSSNYTHGDGATQYSDCKKTSGRRFVASALQQKGDGTMTKTALEQPPRAFRRIYL
ncbi:hypothetical protein BCEN4_1080032 [Burkholderia cenocepacia]|nr:hypothetical protein BCEN4_1080032 [Burkholderia cenocepacia]